MATEEVVRDPEDRKIDETDQCEKKEKMMDKTIADTFPASDPHHPYLIPMMTLSRSKAEFCFAGQDRDTRLRRYNSV